MYSIYNSDTMLLVVLAEKSLLKEGHGVMHNHQGASNWRETRNWYPWTQSEKLSALMPP